jgi:ABC-2 type transport system permease protein/oleandomycin transport system permease protein
MTAVTAVTAVTGVVEPTEQPSDRLFHAVADTITIAQRNLITLRRVPQLLIFSTIQPVIFVLLFRYVFGGAIHVPNVPYVDFLMPGVFAQTVAFGAMNTAIGLAADVNTGLIERFRSLAMARSAVLAGRTLADAVRNVLVVALMATVGFAVGFRVHTNALSLLAALALLVLFGYALSWVFAAVGLAVGQPETAQAAAFPVMAPLVFASSAFVPVSTMPGWLQPFAEHQPLSVVVSASRDLVLGGPTATHVLQALAWCAVILAVAAPLAVRRYRRAA